MATLSSIITPTNITTATNTQTLTNKTLTGAAMNGTLGATTPSTIAATTIAAGDTITSTRSQNDTSLRANFVLRRGAGSASYGAISSIGNGADGVTSVAVDINGTAVATFNISGGNGPWGATTPSTVAATTITASSTITPSQTSGIVGTTTNNNANAGSVGEYVESTVASASKIALTNITGANVTSISLTAGDWDVWGNAYFDPAATTTFDLIIASISTVSATSPSRDTGNQAVLKVLDFGTGIPSALQPVPQRLSLSATTTVYLVVVCSFAVSTMHSFGTLRARRVR